jgi:hypothetical protein
VHKEQLAAYPHLMFDRTSSTSLAKKIKDMLQMKDEKINYNYEIQVKQLQMQLLRIVA